MNHKYMIGNWVHLKNNHIEIDIRIEYFYQLQDINSHPECYTPIPLNEEWLIKFGFTFDDETETYSLLTTMTNFDYLFELECISIGAYVMLNNVEWFYENVHQLQQIFEALTHTGLTIKLKNNE